MSFHCCGFSSILLHRWDVPPVLGALSIDFLCLLAKAEKMKIFTLMMKDFNYCLKNKSEFLNFTSFYSV